MDRQIRINEWVVAGLFLIFGGIFVSASDPGMPVLLRVLPYVVGAVLVVFGVIFHDKWIHRKHNHKKPLHH